AGVKLDRVTGHTRQDLRPKRARAAVRRTRDRKHVRAHWGYRADDETGRGKKPAVHKLSGGRSTKSGIIIHGRWSVLNLVSAICCCASAISRHTTIATCWPGWKS